MSIGQVQVKLGSSRGCQKSVSFQGRSGREEESSFGAGLASRNSLVTVPSAGERLSLPKAVRQKTRTFTSWSLSEDYGPAQDSPGNLVQVQPLIPQGLGQLKETSW